MADDRPGRGAPGPRATTPLLTLVTQTALDEDYRTAATRRIIAGGTPGRGGKHTIAAAAIGIFGILLATAVAQTSLNAEVDAASRRTILERIEQRSDLVASQQARVSELEGLNEELNDLYTEVGAAAQAAESRAARLRSITGLGPVRGPGVRFTLTDAPDGDPLGRIQDADVRLMLSGLWQAGAEAIAIDGQRISSRSSIAMSGAAVQVDGAPLSPPYVVEAIGNPGTLMADFYITGSGQLLQARANAFGFEFTGQNDDSLRLSGAPRRQVALRYAEAIDGSGESTDEGNTE